MGLIDIQFIETTKWFPNKKDNLTVQKRRNKEHENETYLVERRFPGICAYCETERILVQGVSLACCPRFSLSVHVSKPDSGLHEGQCSSRERDGDHVS